MEQNRTKINKERLLKALESSLGVITTALKATDLSRTNFYKWLKEDEEFKAQVEDPSLLFSPYPSLPMPVITFVETDTE
jgi:ACT domain-containing protein